MMESQINEALEDGDAPCPECRANAVGYINEYGEHVGPVSHLPPVTIKCSKCGWEMPDSPAPAGME